jgi:hypothetical protein
MRHGGGSRAIRIAAIAAAAILLVLVLAQILLPRIAASRISSRIGRYGHVEHVSVSAFPAIELLWGDADSVEVKAGSLTLEPGQAVSVLREGSGVSRIDVSARSVHVGKFALTDAVLRKDGVQVSAHARTTRAALGSALGAGIGVRLLGSEGGRVRVAATGSLFGVGTTVTAVAESENGALVVHPEGFLIEGFRLTLFKDPHLRIVGVAATQDASGYVLGMTALLH